jgi:cytochrome c556
VVNRVEGLIDTFGALGRMIKAVFSRDLDALKEAASDAGTAFIQLNTGLDETQQSGAADTIKKVWKETKKATKEATEYGKAITKLRNEVKLAEAEQRGLQLTYQKDAEIQRQIRDDVSRTIEERIEANEELGRVLDKQFAEEKALAQQRIDLAQKESDNDEKNIDLKVALINAETEMADLEERITGQRSEQMVNENALIQEGIDLKNEKIEANAKLREQDEKDLNDALERARKKKEQDIKDAKDEEDRTEKLYHSKVAAVTAAMGAISGAIGKDTAAGKSLALGQAIIDTYVGANKALAQGGVLGFAGAAAIIASGFANVKSILGTDVSGGGGGGGGSAPSQQQGGGIDPASLIPNMDTILPTDTGEAPPVQAYVVETDISNSQALQEELNIQATL